MSPAGPVQITGTARRITPIIRTWAITTGMSQRMTHPVTVTITVQVTRLLTYTGSTRGANLSLAGSKESGHLHLIGKTQITSRQAQVTLNSFISIRLPNVNICRLLTEGRLDTNTCNHQLYRERASNAVYLLSESRPR